MQIESPGERENGQEKNEKVKISESAEMAGLLLRPFFIWCFGEALSVKILAAFAKCRYYGLTLLETVSTAMAVDLRVRS